MKLKSLIFFFFLILISCRNKEGKNNEADTPEDRASQTEETTGSDDSEVSENSFLIREEAAGEFELGEPVPATLDGYIITKVQQTRSTEDGPAEETVYIVTEDGSEMLNILPGIDPNTGKTTDDIGELRIKSEKYKTAKGIGVGSTLKEFIEKYPDYKIWYTYVSGMYVVETEELEAQFLLNKEDFTGNMEVSSVMTPLKKEDFKEGAEIAMIRILP